MRGLIQTDRAVLRLSGSDVRSFLQGLVSNDVAAVDDGLVYAALLSPQGKYLFDFFMARDGDAILLDVKAERAPALAQRLTLYKLRADVAIEGTELKVAQILEGDAEGALADPRHEALGKRLIAAELPEMEPVSAEAWTALRVAHLIPETGVELVADETFLLEAGFEALAGVDYRKGLLCGAGGHRADEAQDRAAQGVGASVHRG